MFLLVCWGCDSSDRPVEQAETSQHDEALQATGAEHVDVEGLLKDFRATFSGDFDAVDARISLKSPGDPWLLISVRPRRAGHFVVRYDAQHEPYMLAPEGETWICEYHLMIGAKGQRRYCTARYAWPLACVGDVVVIPVRVRRALSKHQFFAHGANERRDRVMAKSDREGGQSDPLQPYRRPVVIRNRMPDTLRLIGSGGRSRVSRGLDHFSHNLIGLLEARKAGRFNIRLGPKDADDEDRRICSNALAVAVAPEGSTLSVLAVRCNETTGGANWEWDVLVLRVGDRFTSVYGYTTKAEHPRHEKSPSHPQLELTAEPFQPGGWAPFDIELPPVTGP